MKKVIYFVLVLSLLAALTIGCAAQPPEVIEIESATFVPMNIAVSSFIPRAIEIFNEAGGGQVVWKHLGGPEVMTALDQFDAVKTGVLGASFLVAAYYTSDVPAGQTPMLSKLTPREERTNGYDDLVSLKDVEFHLSTMNIIYCGLFKNDVF